MKKYITLTLIGVFLWSCTTQKNTSVNSSNVKSITSNADFFSSIKKNPTFQQVKINSKITVETGKFLPNIDATFYIENGNKIWMNAAVLINVARALITPEGIKAYEKWNKNYIESDFRYINNLLNVNFIDYNALQNLLIGKTFIPINEKDFILSKNAQGYTLNSNKNQTIKVDGKTTEYKINLEYSSLFKLNKISLQEIHTNNILEVYYSNWSSVDAEDFPKNVKIIIKGEKNSQILIENTKFEFSKMQTPYTVPSGYNKVEIK